MVLKNQARQGIAVVIFVLSSAHGAGSVSAAARQAPQVLNVEPPGWWAGHSINPVRLLIRGRNLHGARGESADKDLGLGSAIENTSGTYLFMDVNISSGATPGKRRIKIATADGEAELAFELLKPLPRAGNFQGFSPDDVIYLIMLDRFANGDPGNDDPPAARGLFDRKNGRYYHGGDLRGILNKLPYLKDLGVTALWLTPFYDNSNRLLMPARGDSYADYHGYGPVDYYSVDEHFGNMAAVRELVEKAHELGIKVIQDEVLNHTGPHHPWVQDRPTPTWFHGMVGSHLNNDWQNWTLADPYATPQLKRSALEGWYFNLLPDLNQNDPEVARYLTQNSLWWVGSTGVDGIRQDTMIYAPRSFWRDWTGALRQEFPHVTVVGEAFDGNPAFVSHFQGGRVGFDGVDTGIEAVFDVPLMEALQRVFTEDHSIQELPAALSQDRLYPTLDRLVTMLGLHDVPRFMSRSGASPAKLKLAFTFLMTTRGIPLIYYGDEVAMRGPGDLANPDNRRDFPGGWMEDPRDAFSSSGRTAEEEDVFRHVQRLARLRARLEPLRRGRLINLAATKRIYAYARMSETSWAIVVLNGGPELQRVELDPGPLRLPRDVTRLEDLVGNVSGRMEAGRILVALPAYSAALYAP